MSRLLTSKISAVRGKHVSVAVGTGVSAAVLAMVLCITAGMLLDWWLDLARWMRTAFLSLDIALVLTLLVRRTLLPIVFGPDDDQLALKVEEHEPRFRTRLIASIQLSRPGAVVAGSSMAMVREMIAQAERLAKEVDFRRVVKSDRMVKLAVAAGVVLLGALIALAKGKRDHVSTDLLKRVFLIEVPVPRKTRIQVLSREFTLAVGQKMDLIAAAPKEWIPSYDEHAGDMTVARGDTAVLAARSLGITPTNDSRNSVEIRFDSSRRQQFPIDPLTGDANLFTRPLENVQDSFNYRINLGDSTSAWFRVTALAPPAVTRIECQQVYPAYTGIGTMGRSLGDLSILAGSRLILKVAANNPLKPNTSVEPSLNVVHLVGAKQDVPMELDPLDPTQLTADVSVPEKTTGFSILLTDTNRLRSKDPAVYRVDLIPDKEPMIRVTYPEAKEMLATKIATVDIGFDATDDYGITQVLLKYKVDDGAEQTIPLSVPQEHPKFLHNYYKWPINRIAGNATTRPTLEGASVEYWLEATDNNDMTGPGKGQSEHFSIRIVTESEKRAEILARLSSSIEGLKGAVEDQKKLHDELGTMVIEKDPSKAP